MYPGFQQRNSQLQQTYQSLQTRAIDELREENTSLKKILQEKNEKIAQLENLTNEGTLQKKLAMLLEENHEMSNKIVSMSDQIQRSDKIMAEFDELKQDLSRSQEELDLRKSQFETSLEELEKVNQDLANELDEYRKYKDDVAALMEQNELLKQEISDYQKTIAELKQTTKVFQLEKTIESLNSKIHDLDETNQNLNIQLSSLKSEHKTLGENHLQLLDSFNEKVLEKENSLQKQMTNIVQENKQRQFELTESINKSKQQHDTIQQLQHRCTQMEELNLKLLKGYDMKKCLEDLNNEKKRTSSLNDDILKMHKQLSLKESTNIQLLRQNEILKTHLPNHQVILSNEQSSFHFDHIDTINELNRKTSDLQNTVKQLENDKFSLLNQLHESGLQTENPKVGLAFFGLDETQKKLTKQFVTKLKCDEFEAEIDQNDIDSNDSEIDRTDFANNSHDRSTTSTSVTVSEKVRRKGSRNVVSRLKKLENENEALQQWKDAFLNHLLECNHKSKKGTRTNHDLNGDNHDTHTHNSTTIHAKNANNDTEQISEKDFHKQSYDTTVVTPTHRHNQSKNRESKEYKHTGKQDTPSMSPCTFDEPDTTHLTQLNTKEPSTPASRTTLHTAVMTPHNDKHDDKFDTALTMADGDYALQLLGISHREISKAKDIQHQIKLLTSKFQQQIEFGSQLIHPTKNNETNDDSIPKMEDSNENNSDVEQLKTENIKLQEKLDDYEAMKIKCDKIEDILNTQNDSQVIQKLDHLTKENMILTVNQKKLQASFINLQDRYTTLSTKYTELLEVNLDAESWFGNRFLDLNNRCESLSGFVSELLDSLAKSVPIDDFIAIQSQIVQMSKERRVLSRLTDKFQQHSIDFFQCKRQCYQLQCMLIENECQIDIVESTQQMTLDDNDSDHNKDDNNEENKSEELPTVTVTQDQDQDTICRDTDSVSTGKLEAEHVENKDMVKNDTDLLKNKKHKDKQGPNKLFSQQIADSMRLTEKHAKVSFEKAQVALANMQSLEQQCSTLHEQINSLRQLCVQQSNKILQLESKCSNTISKDESNDLQNEIENLKKELHIKNSEVNHYKSRTDNAMLQLQQLQAKLISEVKDNVILFSDGFYTSTFHPAKSTSSAKSKSEVVEPETDSGVEQHTTPTNHLQFSRINFESNGKQILISNPTQLQKFVSSLHKTNQSLSNELKSQQACNKTQELQLFKLEQKYHDLQSKHLKSEKMKRVLESQFSCIYASTLHKSFNNHSNEISRLRNLNRQLSNELADEQNATHGIRVKMSLASQQTQRYKIEIESLNDVIQDLQICNQDKLTEALKVWQQKATQAEVNACHQQNEVQMLKDEISFLRSQCSKHLSQSSHLHSQLIESKQNAELLQRELEVYSSRKELGVQQVSSSDELSNHQTLGDELQVASATFETEHVKTNQTECETNNEKDNEILKEKEKEQDILTSKLQTEISKLQGMIRYLQNESKHTESRVNNATHGFQSMIKTAQDTIVSLQELIVQKNTAIEGYKQMIDKLVHKLNNEQLQYSQEISKLKMQLDEQQNQISMQILHLTNAIDENDDSTFPSWVTVSKLKTELSQKTKKINQLTEDNSALNQVAESFRKELQASNAKLEELAKAIDNIRDEKLAIQQKLSETEMKRLEIAKQNKELTSAIEYMKSSLHEAQMSPSKQANISDSNSEIDKQNVLQSQFVNMKHALNEKIQNCKHIIVKLEKQHENDLNQIENYKNDVEILTKQLAKKSDSMHKLQLQISKLQQEKITFQERHGQQVKLLKHKIQSLESQIHQQKFEFESKFVNKSKLISKPLQNQIDSLTHDLSQKNTQYQRMMRECREKDSHIKTLEASLKRIGMQLNANQSQTKPQQPQQQTNKPSVKHSSSQTMSLYQPNKQLETQSEQLFFDNPSNVLASENAFATSDCLTSDDQITNIMNNLGVLHMDSLSNSSLFLNKVDDLLNIVKQKYPKLFKFTNFVSRQFSSLIKEIRKLLKSNKLLQQQQREVSQRSTLQQVEDLHAQVNKLNHTKNKLSTDVNTKSVEISRISNLNKRLKKECDSLRKSNTQYENEIQVLKNRLSTLDNDLQMAKSNSNLELKQRETQYKRQVIKLNDSIEKLQNEKKNIEEQLNVKAQINAKMSDELKALLELLNHTSKVNELNKTNKLEAQQFKQQLTATKEELETTKTQMKEVQKENTALHDELSAFDISFFNEIEDLKYREEQSRKMVQKLQKELNKYESN